MIRKILFMASNPTDTGRLRLDKELREVEEGLRRSKGRDRFDLTSKFAVRVEDFRRSLLDHSPSIVHFTGHGGGLDGIVVEDDQGRASEVPNAALAGLFELCASEIECVVLNACYSDVQAKAIAEYIPYVIGMKAEVSDDAAVEFAVGFYDALGAGKSIEEAFQFGCNAIALKGIPDHLIPVLKKKDLTAAEKQRIESNHSPTSGIFVDISVVNEDTSSWNRGEDTILRYSLDRSEHRIRIGSNLGYLASFNAGGPIAPLNYISPTACAFRWDFPILDFKILNNRSAPLFLTEVVFDIEESRADLAPFLTVKKDTQQYFAGNLLLINEGWCDLTDLMISFRLLPGNVGNLTDFEPPYKHSITLPLLENFAEIDVTSAFQEEGVDIDGLIQLANGNWESQDTLVAPRTDGTGERMTRAEMEHRWRTCLGEFQDEVGTLVGEISFTTPDAKGRKHSVKFYATVYLANKNRKGIPRPPTFKYDVAFDTQKTAYQRRVPVSHELRPGETDRFTVKIAVAKSSFHRFRATLHDITGVNQQSLPIEMHCFVPRFRRGAVENAMSRGPTI